MQQAGKILVVLAFIAYPFLVHVSIRDGQASSLSLLLVVLPPMLVVTWFLLRAVSRMWKPLIVAVFLGQYQGQAV